MVINALSFNIQTVIKTTVIEIIDSNYKVINDKWTSNSKKYKHYKF